MLQNATPVRKSAPWPPNSSDEHVSWIAPATENASLQILFKCPTPAIVFGNVTKPSRFAHFGQGAQSLAPATRNDIWTSKSAPNPWCFEHFDFEMCFAPQRRALFRHLNFQKWSGPGVLCAFWLRNVLRATTACFFDFSTSKSGPELVTFCTFWLRNVLRATTTACNFSSLIWQAGSAPAALASLLFDPHLDLLSSETFSFLIFFLLLSLFSDSSHLSFSFVNIVGSLTSKLPSMNTFRNAIQNPPKLWTFRTSKLQVLVPHDASMLWTCCHCLSSSAAQMGKHCFYLFLVHVNGTVNAKMATRTTKSPPSRVGLSSLASFVNFVRQSPWLQQQPSCLHSLVGRNTWNKSDS